MTSRKTFYIFFFFTLLCTIFQLLPADFQYHLHYIQAQLPSNLYYLWLTPHLVHLGFLHYFINVLSLGVVLFAFRAVFTPLRFFILFAFSSLMVTLGLWCCSPDVSDYAGMSGVIYGILSAGLLWSVKQYPLPAALVFFVVGGKIIYEQFYGPHLSIQTAWGETVIVDAHFYGFLSGILFVLIDFIQNFTNHKKY